METKVVLFALTVIAVAHARPQQQQQRVQSNEPIAIVRYDNEGVNADGSYQWSIETANGIVAQEQGQLKPSANSNEPAESVQGSFQYTADDGTPIQVSYIADENGFQPQGTHLPTPPSIPEAIQKSLDFLAQQPQQQQPQQAQQQRQ